MNLQSTQPTSLQKCHPQHLFHPPSRDRIKWNPWGDNNKNGRSLWYGGNRFSNKNSSCESVAFFGSNSLLTVSHAYDISCELLNYSTHSSSKKLSWNSLRRCVYFCVEGRIPFIEAVDSLCELQYHHSCIQDRIPPNRPFVSLKTGAVSCPNVGYEPKGSYCAMAVRRSASEPRGNPFWSQKAVLEMQLREARPQELPEASNEELPPVPKDDGWEGSGEETPVPVQGPLGEAEGVRKGKGGDFSAASKQSRRSTEYQTPGSGRKTAGEMPVSEPGDAMGLKTQGPEPQLRDETVEGALETMMYEQLLMENRALREALSRSQEAAGGSGTSWSAVSQAQDDGMETPRRGSSERKTTRYTPGGTQVPAGTPPEEQPCPAPPPLPPVPAFPYYEREEEEGRMPCKATMGWDGQPKRLHSEYWRQPVTRWGMEHGSRGRTRQVLADEAWRIDKRPLVGGPEQGGRPEVCQQARALHGERAHQGRAWQDSVHHGDRAHLAGSFDDPLRHRAPHGADHGVFQGDRASHLALDEVPLWRRAPHGAVPDDCHGDRAFAGGSNGMSYHGDQGWHQQLPCRELCDPKRESYDRERSPQEALRTSNPELPKLPDPGQKNSSVDASDWLVEIRPVISDMSTRAGKWWTATMEGTMKVYQQWLAADPLNRLRLMPPQPVRDPSLGNPQVIERLEQRITNVLLPALPLELRRDLIANRQLWPAAVLFRVLRTYQPGGWGEKASVLQELTNPVSANTAAEAASTLRMWRRQRARAEELGAALPDVMLQVKALELIVQKVLTSHQQVSFRVSTFTMNHQLDTNPSQASLMDFLELLTAEMDSLMSLTPSLLDGTDASKTSSPNPKTKALMTSPNATKEKVDLVCRFWGTNNGCHHAKQCRFQHKDLDDKHTRCWHCSATTHQRAECPYYVHPGTTPQDGGSEAGGKAKDGKRGDGKSKTKGGKYTKGGKPNATTNSVQEGRGKGNGAGNGSDSKGKGQEEAKSIPTVAKEQVSGMDTTKPASEQQPATGETSNSSAALEQELTSLLRSLRTEATIRAYSLQKMVPGDGREARVLIDGGATHCLRTCVDGKEWSKAGEIRVMLAEGETTMRQVAETKTLLTKEPAQAIIPMALVTAVGYQVHWTHGQCRITHPGRQDLPVKLEDGCPTIPMDVGMQLFQEVEAHQRQRHQVRAILAGEDRGQSARHQQLQELRGLFPGVPLHLLQRVPGAGTWDASKLPFNRRRRRQLESAKHLVIYAFSGPNEAEWKKYETDRVKVLCLDSLVGVNLLDDNVAAWLEHLLQSRDVDLWLSSPPCKTVSVCRQHDGGPPPLRNDDPIERFGLRDLSPHHRAVADDDTTLWLRNLYWMWLASKRNKRLQALIEQPRDPREWCSGQAERGELDDQPSFLRWPETKRITEDLNLDPIHLEQGALGHSRPKPTTLLSSIPATWSLQGLCCSQPHEKRAAWPSELKDKIKLSQSLAAWAPGLKQLLQKVISNIGSPKDRCPELHKLSGAELAELKAWEDHVRAGHSPYRKDCAICVESRGRDRPHHRQKTVDGFCLSLDISGPYEPGFDQHVDKPRYYITGVVTVPTVGENPLVEGLRALGTQQRAQQEGTPPMAPNSGCGGSSSTAIAGQEDGDADKAENLLEEAQIKAARRAPPRTVDVEDPF